jgi:hypothetical protein
MSGFAQLATAARHSARLRRRIRQDRGVTVPLLQSVGHGGLVTVSLGGGDLARGRGLQLDLMPLGLGGRGPLWLLGPTDSFAGQEGEEGFAFAVVRIDVQ